MDGINIGMPSKLAERLSRLHGLAPELCADPKPSDESQFDLRVCNDRPRSLVCKDNFNKTWLQSPPALKGEINGDWSKWKKDLPNAKLGNVNSSWVPSEDPGSQRKRKGPKPCYPIPFEYAEERVAEFFDVPNLIHDQKFTYISNPSPFVRGVQLRTDQAQKTLALIESLAKESLGQVMGALSLVMFLHNQVSIYFTRYPDSSYLNIWECVLFFIGAALQRSKTALTCVITRSREFIRESVLRRMTPTPGNRLTAESLRFSDFGSPFLFGPVRDEIVRHLQDWSKNHYGSPPTLCNYNFSGFTPGGGKKSLGVPANTRNQHNFPLAKKSNTRKKNRRGGGPRPQSNQKKPPAGPGPKGVQPKKP